MKKYLFASLIFSLMLGVAAQAQDCFKFFPQQKGTIMESKHYDKKDKQTATSTLTILDKTTSGSEQRVDVRMESKGVEVDTVTTMEYAYICKDGKLYVDMSSYLGNQLGAYQGMKLEVDADKLELPNDPKEGQALPGGKVDVRVKNQADIQIFTISVTVTDRKVEKWETLKTEAGEFKCFKITQNTETKLGFLKVKGASAEWIAEGAGVVRSESYDKKGKLISYSVLSKITK